VARVGAMATLFRDWPQALYRPDDAASLATCLEDQLARPQVATLDIPDWGELARLMDEAYLSCLADITSPSRVV